VVALGYLAAGYRGTLDPQLGGTSSLRLAALVPKPLKKRQNDPNKKQMDDHAARNFNFLVHWNELNPKRSSPNKFDADHMLSFKVINTGDC
jgi:hypothetical protein